MNEMELEQKLRAFDYTTLDTVKENLKDKLLAMHRRDNQTVLSFRSKWNDKRLSEDELDYSAAAGTPGCQEKKKEK